MKKYLQLVNQIEFLKFKKEDGYVINPSNSNSSMRKDELVEYNLDRNYDIEKLNTIFKDAQNDKKVLKFSNSEGQKKPSQYMRDKFLGVTLHSNFHISRSEASRYEFWNTMMFQVPEAQNYLSLRRSGDINSILKKLLVTNETSLMVTNNISSPWWIVEMSRNGDSYDLSKVAFDQKSNFYQRWFNSNALHSQILTISFLTYLEKKDWKKCLEGKDGKEYDLMRTFVSNNSKEAIRRQIAINLQTVLNDHISSNEYLNNIDNLDISQNEENYKEWLESSKNIGPKDFQVTKEIIDTLEKQFDLVLDIYMKNPHFSNEIDEE
jgi:hypothetical protein